MGKVCLFILACAVVTAVGLLGAVAVLNRGFQGLRYQTELDPSALWQIPLSGAAAGAILVATNQLGNWPRLRWRRVGLAYAALILGIFVFLCAAITIYIGGPSPGHVVSRYSYISVTDNPMGILYLLGLLSIVCGWVVFKRWKSQRVRASHG